MDPLATVVFASPLLLGIGLALAIAIVALAILRRVLLRKLALLCIAVGAMLLALAAGRPVWNRAATPSIVVMVDLSPSTRGATFRDRAALVQRLRQILGDQSFQMLAFSDGNQPMPAGSMPAGSTLADLPADQTRFAPPSADAIVLLSDGQFELPAFAPPTYPVIDPAMDKPGDAAVSDLKRIGKQVLASVRNSGPPRGLNWTGAKPDHPATLPGDDSQLATPVGDGEAKASLTAGDRWPENDSLSIAAEPPVEKQKWWIGDSAAPAGWVGFTAAALPADSSAYLQASVIALKNIPADAMSSDQQAHLLQYVRDLGGALVIVGGPRAFAAGAYGNTPLDELSPLASSPPSPAMRWMLLIDGSGSMAGDPWKTEVSAVTRLLPQLPAADAVNVGSFAESLSWWSTGKSAGDTAKLALPPGNIGPNGPTNLAATLDEITAKTDGGLPTQLLLMTDADADLPHPNELAAAMNAKKIHLHLLAIGQGSALPALRSVATATDGSVVEQFDPKQWVAGANLLLRSALPDYYQHRVIPVAPAPPDSISAWNQTWLKSAAKPLQTSAVIPIIARWQFGLGQVIAMAYPANASTVDQWAAKIAQPPVDPRFAVSWETAANLRVKVDAIDRGQFINGLSMTLEMLDPRADHPATFSMPIPQTGPGEYELTMPSPRTSQLLCVKSGGEVLRRFAIAGRYPPEFEAIGNNRENLRRLADRTGGAVIPPGPVKPIQFSGPQRQTSLASELAFAGFLAIGAGMIANRRRN
jgi:hypothetical protein